jgi:uncharacterized protein (TIGR03067 family)
MQRRLVVAGFVLLVLGACMSKKPVTPNLTGTWAPDSAMLGGAPLPIPAFNGAKLILTDSTYEFGGDKGIYTLPGAGTPAAMDITGREGPNAGRTIPAIYQLSGSVLTVGYQLDKAGARPASFTSPAGTQILVVRYQRVP